VTRIPEDKKFLLAQGQTKRHGKTGVVDKESEKKIKKFSKKRCKLRENNLERETREECYRGKGGIAVVI
jgi:hypothetical protein